MLDDRLKETEENDYTDNIYMSQSMSYNFDNKYLHFNDDSMQESTINVKTELADGDYEFIEDEVGRLRSHS